MLGMLMESWSSWRLTVSVRISPSFRSACIDNLQHMHLALICQDVLIYLTFSTLVLRSIPFTVHNPQTADVGP